MININGVYLRQISVPIIGDYVHIFDSFLFYMYGNQENTFNVR